LLSYIKKIKKIIINVTSRLANKSFLYLLKKVREILIHHFNSNRYVFYIRLIIFYFSVRLFKITLLYNDDFMSNKLREIVKKFMATHPAAWDIGYKKDLAQTHNDSLLLEFEFLKNPPKLLLFALRSLSCCRILFCGHSYYHCWYLSRELRKLGLKADVYNFDTNPLDQIYYHGSDFTLGKDVEDTLEGVLDFFLRSIYHYDVINFSNRHGISYGGSFNISDIFILKKLGKKICYINNGCNDGVSQTSFSKWGPESVCSSCAWQKNKSVCSDKLNLEWGSFRNKIADHQFLFGGNMVDFNNDQNVHEMPWAYCLDQKLWHPTLEIPKKFKLPSKKERIRVYHAVGNNKLRTKEDGKNIKSSHIYLPLIKKLQHEGYDIELLSPESLPNKDVRFIQAQADIFLEMLTYGWYGSNVREAMMLGKPVICFLRPEWLQSVNEEFPGFSNELPIVSATPETVEAILLDLINNKKKRLEIGKRSREFAVKWHSSEVAANVFNSIYKNLVREKN
jgi:hypothetical protein